MNDFFTVALTAYATGVACSIGVVLFARMMPIPDYAREILCLVMPIPPTCIAFVLIFYGPNASDPAVVESGQRAIMLQTFFIGLIAGPLSAAILTIGQIIKRLLFKRKSYVRSVGNLYRNALLDNYERKL